MNKSTHMLNPMVFVRDESDSAFRDHMLMRAEEASDPAKRLSLDVLKARLAKYSTQDRVHA